MSASEDASAVSPARTEAHEKPAEESASGTEVDVATNDENTEPSGTCSADPDEVAAPVKDDSKEGTKPAVDATAAPTTNDPEDTKEKEVSTTPTTSPSAAAATVDDPLFWSVHLDPSSGKAYFHNYRSGRTTWERPSGCNLPEPKPPTTPAAATYTASSSSSGGYTTSGSTGSGGGMMNAADLLSFYANSNPFGAQSSSTTGHAQARNLSAQTYAQLTGAGVGQPVYDRGKRQLSAFMDMGEGESALEANREEYKRLKAERSAGGGSGSVSAAEWKRRREEKKAERVRKDWSGIGDH